MANVNIEKKVPVDAEIKQDVMDDSETEKENISDDSSDLSSISNYTDIVRISLGFTLNIERYLTRCYDIFLHRQSEIKEENIELPEACKMTLRGSINRYKSSDYQSVFLTFAHVENGYNRLENMLRRVLFHKAKVLSHSEFLRTCALYILAAYDLKAMGGLNEAPELVVDTIAEVISATQQREYLILWIPRSEYQEEELNEFGLEPR